MNGFQIDKIMGHPPGFDLVIGDKYIYKYQTYTLNAIQVHPTFHIEPYFYFFKTVVPKQTIRVVLSEEGHAFAVDLEEFIKNTIEIYRYNDRLEKVVAELE